MTFDSYTVDKRYRTSGKLPAMAMCVTPEIWPFVSRLHQEGNLPHYSMHVVNIDDVVRITEKAFTLFNVVWVNLLKQCEMTDEDTINEWAFPLDNPRKYFVIGFPTQHN